MKAEGGKHNLFILHPSYFILPVWSGRRDSNSRPSAWKADALPTELHPLFEISNFRSEIRLLFFKPRISNLKSKISISDGAGGRIRTCVGR